MTLEENLELMTLSTLLSDTLLCRRLTDSALRNMLKRYQYLIDIFIEKYELPSLVTDSLQN